MTNNPTVAPPRKKKKMVNPTTAPPPPLSSFSSVPDDIIVSCLARISKSHYRSLCLVSKNLYSLLSSPEIFAARSEIGATEARLYVCLWLPTPSNHRHSWSTLSEIEGELSLVPVRLSVPARLSSSYSPGRLNSTTVAVGYEIYQIGGSNKDMRSRAVRVLDCRSHTWRRAPNMMVSRKRAKACFLDGKIYVIGGCMKKREGSMDWGEVLDLKTQTWKPLPKPDSNVDKVAVFGAKLYAFTKNNNKYTYDPKEGRWVPEMGVVCIEPISITGLWCIKWYDPSYSGCWFTVYGLLNMYTKQAYNHRTIQLVNHGGKLVVIWREWTVRPSQDMRICCAVIRLKKRFNQLGTRICGEVQRCNHVLLTVPKSCKLSSCQSVSV